MLLPHLERVVDNTCLIGPLGEIYEVLHKRLSSEPSPEEGSLAEARWLNQEN